MKKQFTEKEVQVTDKDMKRWLILFKIKEMDSKEVGDAYLVKVWGNKHLCFSW